LLADLDGLYTASFAISLTSSSGGSSTTFAPGIDPYGAQGAAPFPYSNASITSGIDAYVNNDPVTDGSGAPATALGGISTILIGTLTFMASSTPLQTTTFVVSSYDDGTLTFDSKYDLDEDAFLPVAGLYTASTPSDFSISTGVPEPTALSVLVVAGLLLRRRPAKA
jgi:hypothetical protein